MKILKISLVLSFLLFVSSASFSQTKGKIEKPGESAVIGLKRVVIGEDLIGPYKVRFSGVGSQNLPYLVKKESKQGGSRSGPSYDKLKTVFSGKIQSPGINEPFKFKNKTPEELSQMEVDIYPKFIDRPYTLYLHLKARVTSHPIEDEESNDAGEYKARISVNLNQIK